MPLTQEEQDTRVDLCDYDPVIEQEDEYNQDWKRYETYGEDLDVVKATDPHHIWTCVECDECDRCADGLDSDCDCEPLRLVAGYHYVNRLYYVITRKPWVTGNEWN